LLNLAERLTSLMHRNSIIVLILSMGWTCLTVAISEAAPRPEWVQAIRAYPVGQSDPFEDEIHRLQVIQLTPEDLALVQRDFADWNPEPDTLNSFFPHCYQSLQLKFNPHEFEERTRLIFDKAFVPDAVQPLSPNSGNRTYAIHIDRYADPRHEGRYQGAILLTPGTGSYAGNYMKFALVMACLKGYIVYAIDLPFHGRSHGHKLIARSAEGEGTGVFLKKAISKDGRWQVEQSLEPGWEERGSCQVNMNLNIETIQEVGRRIAQVERDHLKHLDSQVLTKTAQGRDLAWYGKPVNTLTHVTLIGTSQGGETAFWSADPRATGRGGQGANGIYLPFDSVISHDIYNTAFTAPQSRMRWLRSAFPGNILAGLMTDRDSLWRNTDWTLYYEGLALYVRASDRWVTWRYEMECYRNLLRYGLDHRDTLPQMRLPVLVAIGSNDLLYPSDKTAGHLVSRLFDHLNRDPSGESLWHLQFSTPEGTNGHQLLVHHTLSFADMVDAWIRYRRGGPGSSFRYESGLWKRVQ
jgi:pimeloyl-ACP methyl ester carboxylesterase